MSIHYGASCDTENALAWDGNLRNGIWPRSFVIWVVAFWMALLIVRPWEKLLPELAAFRPERTYAIMAILSVFVAGQIHIDTSFQTVGVLLWASALSISAFFAFDHAAAWNTLYVYYTLFTFYFVLLSVTRTPYDLVFLIISFIVITAFFLGKSQWEFFFHHGHSFSMGVKRLRGINETFAHPNAVACCAVLTLPFLVFLWQARLEISSSWPTLWRRLFPWALAFYFYLTISSVVLTNSRSGMLGVIFSLWLWATNRTSFRKILMRLLLLVLLLAVIWTQMSESTKGRFRNMWDAESGPAAESAHASAEGRIEGLNAGLEMCRRFPAFGVGLGNFRAFRVSSLDGANLVAHNVIGGVLGETGLIGGATFFLFVCGILVNWSRTKRIAMQTEGGNVQVMERLALACRNSAMVILFLGLFGDQQALAQLYWVAAFGTLALTFARTDEEVAPVGTELNLGE